ncbi:zinc finger protein 638 isoform X2 [Oryzias latipes]|uniref:zinc finger protein 638 isoform X2 n=1 Tax=Oryzias latipes TaxID=8090 RepID=UPI000CE254C0|nr:zinc finger protein 638 isoform X2 [Oryzias latipes]
MQKTSKKRRVSLANGNLSKAAHRLFVYSDSNSHLSSTLRLERSATLSIANRTRGAHLIFGPAAAVTALRIAQVETQTLIALQQLALLASILSGNHCCNNELSRVVFTHLALLGLLNRQQVATVGLNPTTNCKAFTVSQRNLFATMYHQRPQQPGSQRFPNAPRPPLLPTPPNQHSNCSNVQGMTFPFPRPTQLPEELESALSIRGTRDMDHRQMDRGNQPSHSSGPVVGQHGGFGSKPLLLSAENPTGHQQGINWSNYPPPKKLFASPPPNVNLQGTQQQTQNRQPHGGGSDPQNVYTPESAGSILASFGLSNEDLEVLSHYPDDQLTPDTLPFILRDIQINKSGQQKNVASTSSSSFSHNIHEMPKLATSSSHPPEVPSLLTVTQTAGKVIDYGHASRGKDEGTSRETFKREPLSSERTVKMYPTSSSSTVSKADKPERRQIRMERKEANKLEDRDYRRTSSEKRRSSRSPARQYPLSPKSRNLDRDYRQEVSKPRSTSEARSDSASRYSVASSLNSRPSSSKKLPTPTMISDFSAMPPKVYPHTCSLCHEQCDEEKDWVDHVNTVNHTSACRDLRNRYPDWKPNTPSRSGRYGSRALWDPKDGSPFHSRSRSPSPPASRRRLEAHSHGSRGRPYSSQHHPRPYHNSERSHRYDTPHHGSHSYSFVHRTSSSSYVHRTSSSSFRGYQHDRRSRAGGNSRGAVKRPHDEDSDGSHRNPPSSSSASSKHGSSKNVKDTAKPVTKTTKTAIKPPPAKKKKKGMTAATNDFVDRLVYLTGIPTDASEQEVTDMVGAFGKINNVILMPCSEEESEKAQGQKASVCMVKAEDARALASSSNLLIRNQEITASVAKKQEDEASSDSSSKLNPEVDPGTTGKNSKGEADQKTVEQKCSVLLTGLPESGWSKNDILQLTQPFGIPSDIIVATNVGKALVFMEDMEVAEEMVKVHNFKTPKILDCEVKMRLVKQNISLSTPVALYNLFMAEGDPPEGQALVRWNSLLVIKNVPDSPSGTAEVLKLVRRFGTVIKTLVLDNTIICEMATVPMSVSVYRRFLMFPCMIQSNPLFFSRKPDPKTNTQAKVFSVCHDPAEDKPANGEDGQAAAAAALAAEGEATVHEETSEPPLEKMEEDEKMGSTETAEESVAENESKEENMETEELNAPESAATPASVAQADGVLATESKQTSAEKTEANEDAATPQADNDGPPNAEEAQTSGSHVRPDCQEPPMPELPKMTQAMVDVLLVECKTRHASRAGSAEVPPSGEQETAQVKTEQSKVQANKPTVEEEAKKQERERKEREVRKEKEREERKRRPLEKEWVKQKTMEQKPKEKRERKEEERREWERKERDRRDWKRAHNDSSSGWRSSHRSESIKQSSRRDDRRSAPAKTTKVVVVEEEEEEENFPFNLSDFVTVDEVGEVLDLPVPFPPAVPLETSQDATSTTVEQEPPEEKPKEAEERLVKSPETESEQAAVLSAQTSNGSVQTEVKANLDPEADASQDRSSEAETVEAKAPEGDAQPEPGTPSQPEPGTPSQPEPGTPSQPEPGTPSQPEPDASVPPPLDSAPEVELPPEASADSSSQSVNEDAVTAERKEENESAHPLESQAEKEVDVLDSKEEQECTSEEEKNGAEGQSESTEAVKPQNTDDHVTKETTTTAELPLPPYDPHQPVGMEYLIPKTGFFCKACSRFFTGDKAMEISHCKTRKHYESLQKFLQTKASSVKTD